VTAAVREQWRLGVGAWWSYAWRTTAASRNLAGGGARVSVALGEGSQVGVLPLDEQAGDSQCSGGIARDGIFLFPLCDGSY
jgi:hypothetical protein